MSLVLASSRRLYVVLLFCEPASGVEAAAAPASACGPDPRLASAVSGCRLVRAVRLQRHWAPVGDRAEPLRRRVRATAPAGREIAMTVTRVRDISECGVHRQATVVREPVRVVIEEVCTLRGVPIHATPEALERAGEASAHGREVARWLDEDR